MPRAQAKYSFPPIVAPDARLLILGTLPGEESLRLQQYYGHPRNHFWPLIAAIFGEAVPADYAERVKLLKRNRCALWDVLESAERSGSSDAAIRNATSNPFAAFFADYPNIRTIAFNGQKARELFRRHVVRPGHVSEQDFTTIDLPSSSPLYTKSLEEKLSVWRAKLLTTVSG
ncbi:G:T/U mismatch-specific DNA glycosylase-like protein [Hyphomicrobium denitrificans 1NES1]|uniref:G:T/U mismatch-specific DNA glycosylase-like protein n=1 Tax=Hyphomicrobium denitrificans 1NES1 TaxID=670307 RepID=N0B0I2_9HYPH|nr:DNA-deoxyinosine glycosylase [Hyphomicrobium denitrificans]AGK56408.1 G:T/U mismatch-specific DNA glycosylase-like protein [Hyphomicrobium denitrificans 1NES1]